MNKLQKIFVLITALLVVGIARLRAYELTGNSPGYTASNVYMVATVLVHETGGLEAYQVQEVANVIVNRFDQYKRQRSIGDILFENKNSFSGSETYFDKSWTNEQVKAKALSDHKSSAIWDRALQIANLALNRQLKDLTNGANLYRRCINKKSGKEKYGSGSGKAAAYQSQNQTWLGGSRINLGQYQGDHCYYNVKLGNKADITIRGPQGNIILTGGRIGGGLTSGDSILAEQGKGLVSSTFSGEDEVNWDNGSFKIEVDGLDDYVNLCINAADSVGSQKTFNLNNSKYAEVIADRIEKILSKVYNKLTEIYIRGISIICYGMYVDYTRILGIKLFDIPNFSYLLSGGTIYLVAFFMAMSVGLYFVDIALKLALAYLFLPISIALWPFPPTKGKLAENISIIIRNSMLLAFVAIGAYFAVALLDASLGLKTQQDIELYNEALQSERSQLISKNYAFFSTHFLLVAFCLIYGFRMIGSAVKDYLDKIFADSVFGGSSPVHHATTGALDFAKKHTVTPMVKGAQRSALRGAGSMMNGLGNIMQGNFSGVKKFGNRAWNGAKHFGSVIAHPWRNTRHSAASMATGLLNKYNNLRKDLYDYSKIFGSRHFYTEKFETQSAQYAAERDAKNQRRIDAINRRLGILTNRDTYADGKTKSETYQDRNGDDVTNNYDKNGKLTSVVRTEADGTTTTNNYNIKGQLTSSVKVDALGNTTESNYDSGGLLSSKTETKTDGSKTYTTYRADGTEKQVNTIKADGSTSKVRYGEQIAEQTPTAKSSSTLTPGKLLDAIFRPMASTRETYQTLSRLADNMKQDWKQADGKKKVIMKMANGAMHFALRSVVETAKEGSQGVGSILKMFGASLIEAADKDKKLPKSQQTKSSGRKSTTTTQQILPDLDPDNDERKSSDDKILPDTSETSTDIDTDETTDIDRLVDDILPGDTSGDDETDPADKLVEQFLSGKEPEAEEDEDLAKVFDSSTGDEEKSSDESDENDDVSDEDVDPLAGIPDYITDDSLVSVLNQLGGLPSSPEVEELKAKIQKRLNQLGENNKN